ncbi:hypothetical protein BC833DRAFT_2297 [Globomyces pollinis-pini]|nr:hypothetical protein BC833DRAFT_2297 [Globomyces pollinis-pini]
MLGVFGCFMIFYFNKNELKAPMGRFLIAYFIADFVNSAAKSFGQIPYKNGETSFACQAQAATIVCSSLSIILFNVFILLLILKAVYSRTRIQNPLVKYESVAILFGYILPIPFATYPLLERFNGKTIFGNVGIWCWYSSKSPVFQIIFFYGPVWIVIISNAIVIAITWHSFKRAEHLKRLEYVTKRMVAFLIAFVITWAIATINRLVIIMTGRSYYLLNVLQIVFSATKGFWDFLALLYCWWIRPTQKLVP